MSESMLRRILRDHQARRRSIALILCLSMVVSLGVFSGLRKDAVAKTYTRVVLECPYMADDAAQVVHTHNDDCYDEVGNLVCTLPELEAHTHGDECYTEVRTLVCGLEENPGHRHTDDCYTAETSLICGLEENEGHQHTGDCYTLERGELLCDNTDEDHEHTDECYQWNEVLSCGMEAGEGAHVHSDDCFRTEWILTCGMEAGEGAHVHSDDCFRTEWILTCGMEEGEGAHTHTDACYLVDRVLTCDKPEIVLHTHTDDCYQKNDDGSIYVDEDGYSWLICGQPEIIEHVHDADCFKVYELDDGEPEETDEAGEEIITVDETAGEQAEAEGTNETEPTITEAENTDEAEDTEEKTDSKDTAELNENEENKEETKDETKEETESTDTESDVPAVPMPAQSFEKTAGGIRVSVEAPEGAFPENTRMSVRPVNGSGLVDTVSDAVNGEILEVQAVDITFYDADDNEIEPATAIRVSIVPANSQYSEEKANVVHIDSEGAATAVEQAEGTTEDNSEVVFDVDSFSIYAIVYTVHFEYEVDGQVYTSSVPGAQDMLLSEVLSGLNIVAEEELETFLTKISDVAVSDPDVIQLTPVEGDWSIRPLKNSEEPESLTVTMQDGATFRITVDAEGITEVRTEDETAVISTVNDLYLPQDATAVAQVLTGEESGSAIAAVQQAAGPDPEEVLENADDAVAAVDAVDTADTGTNYHAFSIGLENVDVESYDGFNVSVTLPEDAVVGRDFQLYQVKEDGTAADITESLAVTSQTTEDGLQAVSELSFTTDSFAEYVLSYSIETYYTTYEGDSLKISLNYGPKAGIPEGAELKVSEILPEDERYSDYLNDSVTELGVKSGAVSFARFLDIEIQKDGEKIEPQAPVSVKIEMMDLPEETGNAQAQVIHFGEQTEVLAAEATGTDVSFETGSFSVYGVVYTVDFHYEVNGQTFEFSIPGGGFISLEHLIEVLGINVSDAAGIDSVTNEAIEEEYTEYGVETVAEEIEEAATAVEEAGDNVSSNAEVDAAAAYEQAINLNNVPVSEETRAFVAEIATVEFSSPQLVWVGKVDEESTVGALKEANGLEVEYSANLTEEQIEEINAQTVEAGDWALVSVRPFVSEESLTVTMENGDSFTIRVTDGQIRKTVIDAILENTEEYSRYLENSAKELGSENDALSFARFFDIEIKKDGTRIEPKSSVQVSIAYKNAMQIDSENQLKVVHFSDVGTEIITEIKVNDDATQITYMQDSFSVTGTIIDGTPNTGSYYMVIATYNGQDYIVNSDGSLSPVQYKSGSEIQFDVEYPMLWEYGSEGESTYIRHRSVASYINPDNQIAEEWAQKYLDPRKELATTMEETTHNHPSLANQAAISYNNGKVSGGGYYLGAAVVDGTLRMVGQKSENDAVLIRFATPPENLLSGNNNHSVNHIDIAVEANAELHVPLAYGTYYDSEGNVLFTVDRNNNKTLEIEVPNVSITHEDIKRSTITAYTNYDSDGDGVKEKTEIPDAFYITGYSSNLANEQSHGNDQVRMEGVFKVANLETYTGRNITTQEWWGEWTRWNDDPNNDPDIRAQRLLKRIYYSVSTPVTVRDVVLKDENGNELYDAQGNLIKVNATATVTASFDYWDEENECPPIIDQKYWWYGFNRANWQSGWIHPVDFSGMDFRLGGDSDTNTETQAVEISKYIVDDLGRTVEIVSPVRSQFDIYYKPVNAALQPSEEVIGHHIGGYDPSDTTNLNNGYTKVDSTHIDVQPGVDLNYVFDYDVDQGMFYISEDKSEENLPQTIVDKNGQVWTYSHTRIETESVWRNDDQNDYKMHVSKDYTRDDNAYESVPEVLGYYTGSYNGVDANGNGSYGSTTYPDTDKETGQPVTKTFRNGFLEFYVYNVYTSGKRLDVKKVWDGGEPDNSEIKVELQYRKRMIKAAESEEEIPENERGEWSDYLPVENDPLFSSNLITELTLKPDTDPEKNWNGSFYNLPKVLTDGEGNIYEVDYTAEETAVLINGTDVTDLYVVTTVKTPATGEDAETNAGTVTITNKKGSLSFVKKWYNTDGVTEVAPPSASPAVIRAELRRNRMVATEVDDIPVVVTLMAKTDAAGSEYVALRSVEVKSGSDLWFSLATSGTSNPTYSANPEDAVPVKHSGYTVTYSNGITKNGNANMFSLSNITVNTTVYAVFPENTLKGKGFGYFIDEDSYEKPGTSTTFASEDEKVGDITLDQSNGWSYTVEALSMEAGWHYYINTDPEKGAVITETGLPENSYTFNPGPIITKDDDGNIVYACTNTSNGVDVTLKKVDISNLNNDGAALLKGATFIITRYTDKNFNIIGEPSWSQTKADTKAGNTYTLNGVFQFTDLPIGFYKIEEPVMPDGYVKTGDDPVFEITSDMSILLYTKNAQGQYVPVNEGYTDIIRISNSKDLYVGNTPGSPLPMTGGVGTGLFTALGGLMTATAGAILTMTTCRRRKKQLS